MLKFNNIDQIKQHKFVGNAYSDAAAFAAIDAFVKSDQHSIADKAEALRQMQDRGMGCGREEDVSDADFVESYINLCE